MNFHQFNVGDKATYILHSDRDAGYIVGVSDNGKRVQFQYAKATLLNGPKSDHPDKLTFTPGGFCGHMDGDQIYEIIPDPAGWVIEFSLRKNGSWKLAGHPYKSPGCSLVPGHSHYYDFNF